MMRSRTSSSRSLTEMIRDNPFLCAAFLSGLSLAALEAEVGSAAVLELMWSLLGVGFRLTAGWPQSLMPGLGDELALAMGIAVGLVPYLLADGVWRRLRGR